MDEDYRYQIDSECKVVDELGHVHEATIIDRTMATGRPKYLLRVEPIGFYIWRDQMDVDG